MGLQLGIFPVKCCNWPFFPVASAVATEFFSSYKCGCNWLFLAASAVATDVFQLQVELQLTVSSCKWSCNWHFSVASGGATEFFFSYNCGCNWLFSVAGGVMTESFPTVNGFVIEFFLNSKSVWY